jgi:hypothetical protein
VEVQVALLPWGRKCWPGPAWVIDLREVARRWPARVAEADMITGALDTIGTLDHARHGRGTIEFG